MNINNPVKEAAADLLEAVRQVDTLEGDAGRAVLDATRHLANQGGEAWDKWMDYQQRAWHAINLLDRANSELYQVAKALEEGKWDEKV